MRNYMTVVGMMGLDALCHGDPTDYTNLIFDVDPGPTKADMDAFADTVDAKDAVRTAAKGRLKNRSTGTVSRKEFNDLLDLLSDVLDVAP